MSDTSRYYSIKEVSEMTGIAPHILRYWETQFPFLKIKRDLTGRRIYSDKDIDKIKYIQTLLYQEGYKIKGVKKNFRKFHIKEKENRQNNVELLRRLLKMLKEIEKCLP